MEHEVIGDKFALPIRKFDKYGKWTKLKHCSTVFYSNHCIYRQTANISRTLVGKKIVDHSDVVGASPVGAAPTTSSFST